MKATVTKAKVHDFDALALGNGRVQAIVLPTLGARLWELTDVGRNRQWIWHREGMPLRRSPVGAVYDDVWAGGWEELFPNDAPGQFEGKSLPDHGEWWATEWEVEEVRDGAEAVVRLTAEMRVCQATCTKELRLDSDSDTIQASYRIENAAPEAFHFLFKQHLPVAITPECRLTLPGGTVTPVDPTFGTLLDAPGSLPWPASAASTDPRGLEAIPARDASLREFVYVTDLPETWCRVDDLERRAQLKMSWDRSTFPFLWLFLSYGGWRDCYTAVLEPCTNMPKDLAEAVRAGHSAHLDLAETFEATVSVTLANLDSTPA